MTLESILINLGIGIICTLLGYRLATSKQKHDDRTSIIRDVAEKYREFIEKNETSDLDGLVRSGIARLSNHDEIEDSIKLIESFGHKDPLRSIRENLEGKDLHDFISIIQKNNINIWKRNELEKAFQEVKMNG